jgi:hypothetical protein
MQERIEVASGCFERTAGGPQDERGESSGLSGMSELLDARLRGDDRLAQALPGQFHRFNETLLSKNWCWNG